MVAKGVGDLFSCRPYIDQQRTVIRDQGRSRLADGLFGTGGEKPSCLIADILNARTDNGAAMYSLQQLFVAQFVEIFTDGLGRNIENAGQLFEEERRPAASEQPKGGAVWVWSENLWSSSSNDSKKFREKF